MTTENTTPRAPITGADIRDLLESQKMDPVLIRWLAGDNAGALTVESALYRTYSWADSYEVASQQELRTQGSDWNPLAPTDEDCEAWAQFYAEHEHESEANWREWRDVQARFR